MVLWMCRFLPEVIDLAVGMSAKAGAAVEAEVVLQDGGDEAVQNISFTHNFYAKYINR